MADRTQRLTRRQQKLSEKAAASRDRTSNGLKAINFELSDVGPVTDNQVVAFNEFQQGQNLKLLGCPGTGKSFIGLALGMREVQNEKSKINKVIIIRSAQAAKQIGHLPGTMEEKISAYEAPYKSTCKKLFGRDDAYEVLKAKGLIEFHSTSFLRGTTIDNAIVLFDEIQNSTYEEIFTVLTRLGERSRVIMCGDSRQDDLTSKRYNEESGLSKVNKLLDKVDSVSSVEFGVDDIVRSGFVREVLVAAYELGY